MHMLASLPYKSHHLESKLTSKLRCRATLLLAHARDQTLNQKRLENYLASSSTPDLDIAQRLEATSSPRFASRTRRSASKGPSGADTPRDLNARVKILELYTLHVLLRNNEWDYAREFISVSSVLDEERRDAFLQALQSLQDEKRESERKEREEQQKQDDQLQKDLEEARKLRAENEARERRRIEEERAKREGSEIDYGVERSSETNGKAGHTRASSSAAISRSAKTNNPKGKGKAVAARPGIGKRATMILLNLRNVVAQMASTVTGNPMLLMRLVAFAISIIYMFGKKDIRERLQRVFRTGWDKVKATAGMGVKVSYI